MRTVVVCRLKLTAAVYTSNIPPLATTNIGTSRIRFNRRGSLHLFTHMPQCSIGLWRSLKRFCSLSYVGFIFAPLDLSLFARQVFLASVVLAAKFVTDRSYSCKAWSKLSGNAVRDVVRAEREVLAALGWNLWIGTEPQPTQAEALLDTEPVVPANGVFVPKDKPLVTFLEPPASDSDLSPPAFDGVDGVGPLQLAGSTETQSTSHGAYEDELSM